MGDIELGLDLDLKPVRSAHLSVAYTCSSTLTASTSSPPPLPFRGDGHGDLRVIAATRRTISADDGDQVNHPPLLFLTGYTNYEARI